MIFYNFLALSLFFFTGFISIKSQMPLAVNQSGSVPLQTQVLAPSLTGAASTPQVPSSSITSVERWYLTCICGAMGRQVLAGPCDNSSDTVNTITCKRACLNISSDHQGHICQKVIQ